MGCYGYICKGCNTSIRGDCFSGGESCVLFHVRHGEVLGRIEGHYNEYGSVIEDKAFPSFECETEGVNSHSEICDSLFGLEDSYLKVIEKRIYEDKPVTYEWYLRKRAKKDIENVDYDITKLFYYSDLIDFAKKQENPYFVDLITEMENEYLNLINLRTDTKAKTLMITMSISFKLDMLLDSFVWNFYNLKNHALTLDFFVLPLYELEKYSGIVAYHSKCYEKAKKDNTFTLVPSRDDPNQSWGKIRKKYS